MSLRHAVLGVLDFREMHGYELTRVLQDGIGLIWPIHHSSLYPNLHRLEAERLITHRVEREGSRPQRKVYSITADGRAEFRRWLQEPPDRPAPEVRSPFMLKLMFTRAENLDEALAWVEKELSEAEGREANLTGPPSAATPLVVSWLQETGRHWNELYGARLRDLRDRLVEIRRKSGGNTSKINAVLAGLEKGSGGA
jgi:DNA-binding PadR family transcriptional regulator